MNSVYPFATAGTASWVIGEEACQVREMPGLDGPIDLDEAALQRLWAQGLARGKPLPLEGGGHVEVVEPGWHNHEAGPDFREALVRLNGQLRAGDVELHLEPSGWDAHGHDRDPAYEHVVLHVCLWPPAAGREPARTRNGRAVPLLVWLPWLPADLETLLEGEAVPLESHEPALEAPRLGPAWVARPDDWPAAAARRWEAKVRGSRALVDQAGWAQACHLRMLEGLGYRRNREAFARLATDVPAQGSWAQAPPTAETLWEQARAHCTARGCRPANHPRRRLEAYALLLERRGCWWDRLARQTMALPRVTPDPRAWASARTRRLVRAWRQAIAEDWLGGSVSGGRLDTLVVDVLLPLAQTQYPGDLFGLWCAWPAGDARHSQKVPKPPAGTPAHNAWCQAALAGEASPPRLDG